MLFRPLFITAFLLDDFLADNGFFGARTVDALQRVEQDGVRPGVPAVARAGAARWSASPRRANADFVARLGCYDRVVTYDQIASLPRGPARSSTWPATGRWCGRCTTTSATT